MARETQLTSRSSEAAFPRKAALATPERPGCIIAIAVLTPHALYHIEVKGYHGEIRGNPLQWVFENGGVYPSPIPLANKKTKVLAGKLRQYSHRLDQVFVETLILLTEDCARAKLNNDQAGRVVHLRDAVDRLSDPKYLPVTTGNVAALADKVCEALFTTRPAKKVQRIGLYDIVEKLDQDDRFTVFLARHRFIQTQPLTVLKVYHHLLRLCDGAFDLPAEPPCARVDVRVLGHALDRRVPRGRGLWRHPRRRFAEIIRGPNVNLGVTFGPRMSVEKTLRLSLQRLPAG